MKRSFNLFMQPPILKFILLLKKSGLDLKNQLTLET